MRTRLFLFSALTAGLLAACADPYRGIADSEGGFPPLAVSEQKALLEKRLGQHAPANQPMQRQPTNAQNKPVAFTQPIETATVTVQPPAGNSYQKAVSAFMQACAETSSNPSSAPAVLKKLGFREDGLKRGRAHATTRYSSPYATASLTIDNASGQAGQCTVTPKNGNFSSSVRLMHSAMASSGLPARQLRGEEAWIIGNSGVVVLISRKRGAMTRTQPGVFRG